MALHTSDLPKMSEEPTALYQAQKKIFPKRVTGFFRSLKWQIMAVTLGIYYLTPWIRWDRGPHAPDQAVLVDLANQKFYFFFIEIWPQEFFYIAGLLIMAGIGLFLVTSTVGRAWCGYTCPQTVWVDLFLAVERYVEGDRNQRIKLHNSAWTFNKIYKTSLKYTIWLLIAIATGGAWIFYFADAPTLARDFVFFQAPPVAYYTVGILTATTFVLAGFMREQVCTYMCPWPRIQGAMLDEDSLVITYNDWRGEPRQGHLKKQANITDSAVGDCVDCNACVAVCPMGIDIRNGQQLECITCGLCIDACDNVMDKIGKPRSLIGYSTIKGYEEAKAGKPSALSVTHFVRPRTFIYAAIWSLIGFAMLFVLMTRDRLDLNVLRDRNPIYVQMADGSIRNGYTIKVLNMMVEPRTFTLSVSDLKGAKLYVAGAQKAPNAKRVEALDIQVGADTVKSQKIYLVMPRKELKARRTNFSFVLKDKNGTEETSYRAIFEGP